MSSVDAASYAAQAAFAPLLLMPGSAGVVPNSLGQRLRVRQRLGPQVYIADCLQDQPPASCFSAKQRVLKVARLLRPWERGDKDYARGAWQELRVARQLLDFGSHRNVVRIHETVVDNGMAFIVMEHCVGGDLFAALLRSPGARFAQRDALVKLHQITSGVQYLHQRNIAHRDLSLENILVQDGECKVCDFGLSARADSLAQDAVGKTLYAAPEVVQGGWYDPVRADLWSLGVVLFMMLTGSPLVQLASPACPEFRAFAAVGMRGVLRAWGMEAQFSAATIDLLAQLLQVNPVSRLASAKELLAHPAMLAVAAAASQGDLTRL